MAEETKTPSQIVEAEKLNLKHELQEIIYKYGDKREMLCTDVIDILADLTKEMVYTIANAGEEEEEEVVDGQPTSN